MTDEELNIENIKSYWMIEADEALNVADHLFEKKDYSYALFFGHLAVEKILKSLYVDNKNEHAPPIHNLQRLANLSGISLDEDKTEKLILILKQDTLMLKDLFEKNVQKSSPVNRFIS